MSAVRRTSSERTADPDRGDDGDLDAAIEEVYAHPPSEFVAAREALVRQLRQAKRRDDARTVHALARPTLVAWVVDQLAHRHAEELGRLAGIGSALRDAQERALRGEGPAGLRDAAQQRRRLVADLVALARPVLEERGTDPDAHLDELAAALDALTLDADAAALAVRGRLARVPAPPSGLGFDLTARSAGTAGPAGGQADPGGTAGRAQSARSARSARSGEPAEPAEPGAAGSAEIAARRDAAGRSARRRHEPIRSDGVDGEGARRRARALTEAEQAVTRAGEALSQAQHARDEADAACRAAGGRADEIAATLSRVEAELAEWRSRHRDAERELSKLSRDLRRRGTDVDRAHDAYEKARARLDGLRHPGTGPPTR